MEITKGRQGCIDASPSKITDYYTRSKGPGGVASTKNAKAEVEKMPETSVYLTPESSPGTDLDVDPVKETDSSSAMSNDEAAQVSESDCADFSNVVSTTSTVCNSCIHNSMNSESGLNANLPLLNEDAPSTPPQSSQSTLLDSCNITVNSPSPENVEILSSELDSQSNKDPTISSNSKTECMSSQNTLETGPTEHLTPDKTEMLLPEPSESQKIITSSNATRSASSLSKDLKGGASHTITTMSSDSEIPSSPSLPQPKLRKSTRSKGGVATAGAEPVRTKPGRRKKKDPEPTQKSIITDFFPIRRSGRQTKSEIEKEKQHQLREQILSQCEDGLEIKEFENKGRGVVATKDFLKGDFVVEYSGDLIDVSSAKEREKKYGENPQIGCYMYYFACGGKQHCVDATAESGRLGRLLNHSREGNCCTRALMVDDQPRLILVASRDIKSGEELCYDYGDRSKAALEAHPWLKS